MGYKQYLRITEGNKSLAVSVDAYLKRRDKLTLVEWKTRLKPLLNQAQNNVLTLLKNKDLTEWQLFNLNRIKDEISSVITTFNMQFKSALAKSMSNLADLGVSQVERNAVLIKLTPPSTVVLGEDLIANLLPLSDAMIDFFSADMAKIISNEISLGLVQNQSVGQVALSIKDKFGIDSQMIRKLETEKALLQSKETLTAKEAARLKTINAKLSSGSMMSSARAERIATTEMLKAVSMAEDERGQEVGALNPEAVKIWVNSHKPGARRNHIQAEQISRERPIKMNELFLVPGFKKTPTQKARMPRALNLDPGHVVYCGCTQVILNKNDLSDIPNIGLRRTA